MACSKGHPDSDIEEDGSSSEFSSGQEISSGTDADRKNDNTEAKTSKADDTFKRKSRTLTFRRKKGPSDKSKEGKKSRNHFWTFRLKKRLPVRLKNPPTDHGIPEQKQPEGNICVCTGYRRTEDHVLGQGVVFSARPFEPYRMDQPSSSITHVRANPAAVMGATASGAASRIYLEQPHASSALHSLFHQVPPAPQNIPQVFDLTRLNFEDYPTEDIDELLIAQRARDIEQGIEISPQVSPYHNRLRPSSLPPNAGRSSSPPATSNAESPDSLWHLSRTLQNQCMVTVRPMQAYTAEPGGSAGNAGGAASTSGASATTNADYRRYAVCYMPRSLALAVHTQVDYIHCLVPDLLDITNCSFYWGVMDRYEAEKLLENKPEGTFLLRDSAQEEFLFSVSFRRYGRSLHARIEQWNHRFSFDSHDPGVYASDSVCGLLEHYKDPSCCMFFEPMLTLPLHRSFTFSLQHLCRSVICSRTYYDGLNFLPLPKSLHAYLKYYHYKQKVRVRKFDCHQ